MVAFLPREHKERAWLLSCLVSMVAFLPRVQVGFSLPLSNRNDLLLCVRLPFWFLRVEWGKDIAGSPKTKHNWQTPKTEIFSTRSKSCTKILGLHHVPELVHNCCCACPLGWIAYIAHGFVVMLLPHGMTEWARMHMSPKGIQEICVVLAPCLKNDVCLGNKVHLPFFGRFNWNAQKLAKLPPLNSPERAYLLCLCVCVCFLSWSHFGWISQKEAVVAQHEFQRANGKDEVLARGHSCPYFRLLDGLCGLKQHHTPFLDLPGVQWGPLVHPCAWLRRKRFFCENQSVSHLFQTQAWK